MEAVVQAIVVQPVGVEVVVDVGGGGGGGGGSRSAWLDRGCSMYAFSWFFLRNGSPCEISSEITSEIVDTDTFCSIYWYVCITV